MVLHYEAAVGGPIDQRDARSAHRIVVPAADKASGLAKIAPQVFVLDAAGDATCDFGQISSLLLASVAAITCNFGHRGFIGNSAATIILPRATEQIRVDSAVIREYSRYGYPAFSRDG